MQERYKTMLLFGGPGVGKGTQGKLLGEVPGFHHVSTGEMFRTLDPDSDLGQTFLHYSSRGELVPDDVTVKLFIENIHARQALGLYRSHRDLLVLDGIPRNVRQCELLEPHVEVSLILHLVAPDREVVFDRLRERARKEGRPDDAREEVVRRRWEIYDKETRPVLEFYDQGLVQEIDAIGSVPKVLSRVLAKAACAQPGT